jgi:hypothetical protein
MTFSFEIVAAITAVAILQACAGMTTAAKSQCKKPTLFPASASGSGGTPITVRIKTETTGAYLRWTDDGSKPVGGFPGHGKLIKASSGPAPTVFGRTLKALAFKIGLDDSPIASGDYISTPHP